MSYKTVNLSLLILLLHDLMMTNKCKNKSAACGVSHLISHFYKLLKNSLGKVLVLTVNMVCSQLQVNGIAWFQIPRVPE